MNWIGTGTCVLTLLLVTSPLSAEVYQWKDAEGKVHFSDKKPARNENAENISDRLEQTNVDQSAEQRQRLNQLFAKETEEERQLRGGQGRDGQTTRAQQEKLCRDAKYRLKLLRGRVVFPDGKGGYVSIPESERERRAEDMQQQVTRLCR